MAGKKQMMDIGKKTSMSVALSEEEMMTSAELRRKGKHDKVVEELGLLGPSVIGEKGLSAERLLRVLAHRNKISISGVRVILRRRGLYTNNAELAARYTKNC